MRSIINLFTIAAFGAIFFSCNKKDDAKPTPANPAADTGSVHMELFNVVGGSNLKLNNQWYKNENGDSFTVSKFNYYISNIKLTGSSASYAEQDSYHLVEQPATSGQDITFEMAKVPAGKYNSITFTIGVDSLHNVSGAQGGDLDPAMGNFWSWNTGYIMLKFEGNSPKASTVDGRLMLHCGGFSGANSVVKTITIALPNEIEVTKTEVPHLHLQADVLNMFKGANVISFATTTTIHMPGADAKKLSDNYANMFSVTHAGH